MLGFALYIFLRAEMEDNRLLDWFCYSYSCICDSIRNGSVCELLCAFFLRVDMNSSRDSRHVEAALCR